MGDVNLVMRSILRVLFAAQLAFNYFTRPRVRGAHVAVLHADRILIVKNSYRRGLGMPAGRIGRGESAVAAACRELEEEVGIVIEPESFESDGTLVVSHEWMTDEAHVFSIRVEMLPTIIVDQREVLWARFMTRAELASEPQHPVLAAWMASRNETPTE